MYFSLFPNTPFLVLRKKLSCQKNKSANQTVKEEKKRINENNDFLPAQNTCKMSSLKSDSKKRKWKKEKKEKFLVLYYQSVSVILFLAPRKCWGWDMKKLECDLWYTTFPVNT